MDRDTMSKEGAWQMHQQLFMSNLGMVRRCPFLNDAILVSGTVEIPVNRGILCVASPFFQAVFQSLNPSEPKRVVIQQDVSSHSLQALLNFLHTGDIPQLNMAQTKDLMHAAHVLQVMALFNYCMSHFGRDLRAERFVELWQAAQFYNEAPLRAKLVRFVTTHFGDIAMQSDFLQMTAAELKEILKVPELKEGSVDVVAQAIIAWTKGDPDGRKGELNSLMSFINLNDLSSGYLNTLMNDEELITENQVLFNKLVAKAFARMRQ